MLSALQIYAHVKMDHALTRAMLDECVVVAENYNNPTLLDTLARRGIVNSKPKLSKLKTIGKIHHVFTDPEVFTLLSPHYTTLYYTALIYKRLEGTDEFRKESLIAILRECKSRTDIETIAREIKD